MAVSHQLNISAAPLENETVRLQHRGCSRTLGDSSRHPRSSRNALDEPILTDSRPVSIKKRRFCVTCPRSKPWAPHWALHAERRPTCGRKDVLGWIERRDWTASPRRLMRQSVPSTGSLPWLCCSGTVRNTQGSQRLARPRWPVRNPRRPSRGEVGGKP